MANPATSFRRSTSEPSIAISNQPRRMRKQSITLYSALTEERLREHTHLAAASSTAVSPYYRGLTDSALYLKGLGGGSPDRESVAPSFAASTRSFSSTVLIRMNHWGSFCFSKRRGDGDDDDDNGKSPPPAEKSVIPPPEKPLRERIEAPVKQVGAPEAALEWWEPCSVVPPPEKPSMRRIEAPVQQVAAPDKLAEETRPERGFAWANKYRPKELNEFLCNREQAEELQHLAIAGQWNHFIFEGPAGVGKKTMVSAFLREAFGPAELKTKNELKKIELKGESVSSIDVNVKMSSQHVEVNLSEVCGYEKHVIVALINESHSAFGKAVECKHNNSQVIVLYEAEKISSDAQHYVRWLMEKHKGCNRIFFCCSDSSKLQAVKHLCKLVKLQPPSDNEIVEVLELIAKKEQIELPNNVAEKIAKNSNRNLRQSIRSFEASWNSNCWIEENLMILTGWEEEVATIAEKLIEEQSPKQLYIIRGKLKILIEHNVSPDFIFSTLITELKKHLDGQLQTKLDKMYHDYSTWDNGFFVGHYKSAGLPHDKQDKYFIDQRKSVHQFMRIEEFTAKFMSFYKSAMIMRVREMNSARA